MITGSELITELRQALKDTATDVTKQKRSDSTYLLYLNAGQNDFIELTKCLIKETTFNSVADQSEYEAADGFPSDFLGFSPLDILDNHGGVIYNNVPLEIFTVAQLDYQYPGWRSAASGLPDKFAIDGWDTLILSIPPSSANVGTDYIKMRYVALPIQFTTGNMATQSPFNAKARLTTFQRAPLHYALREILTIDGEKSKAEFYDELFTQDVEKAHRFTSQSYPRKGGFKPSNASAHSLRTPHGD